MARDHTKNRRLDSLIKLRETDRDVKRALLASSLRSREVLTGRITDLERSLEQLCNEWRVLQESSEATVERLVLYPSRRDFLEEQRRQLAEELERLDGEIAVKQAALEESVRQVKVLEKLKVRRQEAAVEEERRRDEKFADDHARRLDRILQQSGSESSDR